MPVDFDVIVIGAGAAGLVAAERAASRGRRTLLLEKNPRAGIKILMSGGTRCNLTHATDARGIVEAYGAPGRFLHSALAALGPGELVAIVEDEGVATHVEETGKIFPDSGRAGDVLEAFLARLRRSGARLALAEPVAEVRRTGEGDANVRFEVSTSRRTLTATSLVLTTGGQSYPGSGTTGDGYGWARELGHTIVTPRPALVPLVVNVPWVRGLSGITIPDVGVRILDPGPADGSVKRRSASGRAGELAARRGSLLFTHFGLSGPVVLDVSRSVSGHPRPSTLVAELDFLPGQSAADLERVLSKVTATEGRRQLLSAVPDILPRRLADSLVRAAGLDPEGRLAELSRSGRGRLSEALQRQRLPLAGTRGFAQAEVTAGGVALGEVDSRTLESKLVPGLYLAGEILDLDGPIGGYNFQAAFSTGWLAGLSA